MRGSGRTGVLHTVGRSRKTLRTVGRSKSNLLISFGAHFEEG
jgi:hypothetical protein